MSEWISVIAVFWILWAIDGVKIAPRAIFTVAEWSWGSWCRRAWIVFARLSVPGPLPANWRITTVDVPLAISPRGICNRPAGAAGRPGDAPTAARAWTWDEVRDVAVNSGWLMVNGARFCRDTGHVTPAQVLAIARLPAAQREASVRAAIRLWFRPAHLRRRLKKLIGRTQGAVQFNHVAFAGFGFVSVFLVADLVGGFPAPIGDRIVPALPWVLLGALVAHFAGVIAAWRALRRLPPLAAQKRGANLFTALLMPPQAMRLRAMLGEGFFPAQHPLAVIFAFGNERARAAWAFYVIADLRWPIGQAGDSPLAREIAGWFRTELEGQVSALLRGGNLASEVLLAPPPADSPGSCSYCPRCRDQFVAGVARCPHGIELCPVPRA